MVQWPTYSIPPQAPFWTKATPHPIRYNPGWAEQQAAKEITACGGAEPRWDTVWKQVLAVERLVSPDRRDFYQTGVLTMISINPQSNRMLLAMAEAVQDLHKGEPDAALAKTNEVLADIKASKAKAEYGK